MKRTMYCLAGFAWGIFFTNKEILAYAIFITILTIVIDICESIEKKHK